MEEIQYLTLCNYDSSLIYNAANAFNNVFINIFILFTLSAISAVNMFSKRHHICKT